MLGSVLLFQLYLLLFDILLLLIFLKSIRFANSIDPSIRFQLAKFVHPKDAWDYLARLYVQTKGEFRMLIKAITQFMPSMSK